MPAITDPIEILQCEVKSLRTRLLALESVVTPPPKPKRMVRREVSGRAWKLQDGGVITFSSGATTGGLSFPATLIFEEEEE